MKLIQQYLPDFDVSSVSPWRFTRSRLGRLPVNQ